MTRINLLPPIKLTDSHLIAEIKEINQLSGSFRKSLSSKNGIKIERIPKRFTLNIGHVYFFYDKALYLHKRFNLLKIEALNRKFEITAEFNNEWLLAGRRDLYNDWQPCDEDVSLIVARIKTRLREKPYLYRYKKEKISDIENFINLNYES